MTGVESVGSVESQPPRYDVLEHGGHVAEFTVRLFYDLGHLVGIDVECPLCGPPAFVHADPGAEVRSILTQHAKWTHAPAPAELVDRAAADRRR